MSRPQIGDRVTITESHVWRGFSGIYVRDQLFLSAYYPVVKLDVGYEVMIFRCREFEKEKASAEKTEA